MKARDQCAYLQLPSVRGDKQVQVLRQCVLVFGVGGERHPVVDVVVTSNCERVDGVVNELIRPLLSNDERYLLLRFLEVVKLL